MGDGVTLDTLVIQTTFDAAADEGGFCGVVLSLSSDSVQIVEQRTRLGATGGHGAPRETTARRGTGTSLPPCSAPRSSRTCPSQARATRGRAAA